jgi:predicted  nucleic acid-binding Zn-ribbon protein
MSWKDLQPWVQLVFAVLIVPALGYIQKISRRQDAQEETSRATNVQVEQAKLDAKTQIAQVQSDTKVQIDQVKADIGGIKVDVTGLKTELTDHGKTLSRIEGMLSQSLKPTKAD